MKFRKVKKFLKRRLRLLEKSSVDRSKCRHACCFDCNDICGDVCKEAYSYIANCETGCRVLQAKENLSTLRAIMRARRKQ